MAKARTPQGLVKQIAQLRIDLGQARATLRSAARIRSISVMSDRVQATNGHAASHPSDELARQYRQDLEFLSSTGLKFLEMKPEDDLLSFVGEQVYTLAEDAIVTVAAYNAFTNRVTVHAIFGLDQVDRVVRLLGRHPVGLSMTVTDKYRQMMAPGELVLVPDGLYGLTFEQIPLPICRSLERLSNLKNIYAAPFAAGADLLGTVAILSRSTQPLRRAPIIQAFLRQAAIAVQRRRADQALRQTETKYRIFFEHLQEMICVCEVVRDEQGEVVDWIFRDANAASLRVLGLPRDALIGQRASQILDERFLHRNILTNVQVLATGEPEILEIHLQNQHFLVSVFRIDENTVAFVGIDITERQQREQQLEVYDRDLAKHAAELEIANRELESFSYSVSHDLRTPLASMQEYSRLALEDCGAQLPEEGQQLLRLIHENAIAMNRLVEDLLAFSRTTRQPLNKERVDMQTMVRQIVDELRGADSRRQVEISLGDLPSAEADPVLFKQVWINLLSNAFKFTRSREVAHIEIGAIDRDGETVYFVQDNGVGFDMERADKLFGVFQRLHSEEDYEGTGVGLAIVERIVHRHGGRVWAEAKVDQGATFYFTSGKQTKPATLY